MDYNNIIGHENITNSLKNAVKNNNIAHSYLFEGPKSIGKTKVAKIFAKTLLCKEQGVIPCNKCSSCLKFDSGNHPDVHIRLGEGATFKKEQIEEIQKSIKILPYEGYRKIYILQDIDKITKQAQNSFLKTLEEPPAYVTILMTVTNSYSLLSTIISRCQVLKFTPVESGKIVKELIKTYEKSREEAEVITSFSNGIIGKAIEIAKSEEFKKIREEVISIISDALSSDKVQIFTLSEFFMKQKEYIEEILDIIMIWFRDVLFMKELGENKFIINKDKIEMLLSQSIKLPRGKIHSIIQTISKAKSNILANVNYELTIEIMLLEIQGV